ncbi:phosphate acetyltransferase [Sediminitomix flava]|uniref:Phosphate acetyltransferase n=1 Tax=Sediminitomix flava TaxID=379075 RepID=A0A315Z580_SEDFL|nr:phosphate acetyltransferase [Sediminitomix flava]PWJ38427.1 phosphate acetyltransferase [Sediminitomix flava]
MAKSIFISTAETKSGKSLLALGIIDHVLRKTSKVGFFRPLISEPAAGKKDVDIDLIISHFNLNQTYEESYAFTKTEAHAMIAKGQYNEMLSKIIEKYKALESKCDFILLTSSDFSGEGSAFEFNHNADIAKNLGIPVLVLGNAHQKNVQDALTPTRLTVDSYLERECQVAGVVINRASNEIREELITELNKLYDNRDYTLSVIPCIPRLNSPSLRDVAEELNAKVLWGEERLDTLVHDYSVAAMEMQNFLGRLREDCLVITPGDRGDIITGCLQASLSKNYPNISGILLSTGLEPQSSIYKLLEGLPDPLPILSVETNTYETSALVKDIEASLKARDKEKIAICLKAFEEHVDIEKMDNRFTSITSNGITPKMFTYNLVQKAKANKQHIVLPEGKDPRILMATADLLEREIVNLTLLGNKEELQEVITKNGILLDLDKVNVVNPTESPKFESYAEQIFEMRKHKGVTMDVARDLAADESYYGTMMVMTGDADGMVSGAINTTSATIRPALQLIKTKPGCSVVSSVFFMALEDRVLVYGDCAVNPNPNSEQLAEIALTSAETAAAFNVEPKVALLSYSSGASGKGEDVEKVRNATKIAKERNPEVKLDGPIQYDAAVDAKVGAQKMPGSPVAGQASVLIFPDLNTGNNTYKAVQRETGAIAIGPVLQGLNKPVNDLSRGCLVDDIINTVVITAIQAQNAE